MIAAEAMKIIRVLCKPTSVRYDCAFATDGTGVSSSLRMNIAPSPPMNRKARIITRYCMPITL